MPQEVSVFASSAVECLPVSSSRPTAGATSYSGHRSRMLLLTGLWMAIFAASLWMPPLLDDADATHAQAARHIVETGDWVTLQVDGIRYLEKAPLPYWLVATSYRLLGYTSFATHLPQALAVLALALFGSMWSSRVFGGRAGLYTGYGVLTSAGVFLFTRVFIPEVELSLLLSLCLFLFLFALDKGCQEDRTPARQVLAVYGMWVALALAVLTKGLVAIVLVGGAASVFLLLTDGLSQVKRLRPVTGLLLFLAVAAPWHVLAGLRNQGGANGHGFFWFYFVNEHFLRFLGKRIPMDYNKLPGFLFWSLHLVWLFPWSLFAPVALSLAWRKRAQWRSLMVGERGRSVLLLAIFAALILGFFSLSTNQEYYTFPAYLPLIMLIAASLAGAEMEHGAAERSARRWLSLGHGAFAVLAAAAAIALALGLWQSRHLPFVADVGDLLAHRGVGDYTLSMSHFFDLTGPSFAALRTPAVLAAVAFAVGPALAWYLRRRRLHLAATSAIATTSAVFLIAAHLALVRFAPMLSSEDLAAKIQELEEDRVIAPGTNVLLYGDQAYGSSIPFYLGRRVELVNGRSTSLWFGSTFADAPHIFLTGDDLLERWGSGERKILFVPLEKRDEVDRLLGGRQVVLAETSGKALITDRPLDAVVSLR